MYCLWLVALLNHLSQKSKCIAYGRLHVLQNAWIENGARLFKCNDKHWVTLMETFHCQKKILCRLCDCFLVTTAVTLCLWLVFINYFYNVLTIYTKLFNIVTLLVWQEELDWNETLIKRYIGREVRPLTLITSAKP